MGHLTEKHRSGIFNLNVRSQGDVDVRSFDKLRGVGIARSLYSALNVLVHLIVCPPDFTGVNWSRENIGLD